ncbi:hypothetical protein NDU88_002008 [Pleurodeles waltl]|uniref:Secreted protein n=1 Tax=Pleurodeles waltl TaxID=8319 RepID=A0AAV7VC13_PLEWA|nr:hypothetical protein NDU88_002008 [Pleurodeles waltl]
MMVVVLCGTVPLLEIAEVSAEAMSVRFSWATRKLLDPEGLSGGGEQAVRAVLPIWWACWSCGPRFTVEVPGALERMEVS